jgi:hypothetical protein
MSTPAVSVTVCPAAIVTLSPATGTTPPTQVAVLLQLPLVVDVIVVCDHDKVLRVINKKDKKLFLKKLSRFIG